MKNFTLMAFCLSLMLVPGLKTEAQESKAIVYEVEENASSFNYAILKDSMLNEKDEIYPIFTHNFNPGGGSGTYVDYKQGIWYNSTTWRIFNQDKSKFVENSAYNILIPDSDIKSWMHTTKAENINANQSAISHPKIDGNPDAIIFISDVYKGKYNHKINGLFYHNLTKTWKIYNQGGIAESMDEGLTFNVIIPNEKSENYSVFVHKALKENTNQHVTKLDHPDLSHNPDAIVFVTPIYNPGGKGGVYNDHNYGVYYNGTTWCIYNEDFASFSKDAAFNVLVFKNKEETSSIENKITTTDMKIFPNPASPNEEVTLTIDDELQGEVTIQLIHISGTSVYQKTFSEINGRLNHQIDLREIKRGMYLLQVQNGSKLGVQKLIIR